jgi:endonuclease YncB( thermonuclease family)
MCRRIKLLILIFLFLLSSVVTADISGTALIVDGDTITISGTKIRLSGIDHKRRIKPVEQQVLYGIVVMKSLRL